MPKMSDGSVVSSYFNIKNSDTGKTVKDQGSRTVIGQIEKIHFTNDPTNISKKVVEYDVSVKNEQGGQTTYKNVRSEISLLGGFNDFQEIILEPNDAALKGRLSTNNLFENKNGTIVYLSFRDSSLDKPYISSTADHPKKIGARREDGVRAITEFRGLSVEVNKSGELILTYNGSKTPDGRLDRPETGPTSIKIDRNGSFTVSDNSGRSININRLDESITLEVPGNSIIINQEDGTITATNASGKIFKLDSHQTLGEGTEPIVLGDTLFDMLDDFLDTTISGIAPGSPGQNAASLIEIKDAATTLQGVLENFKSANSRTD